jgi:hypothetical protein
VTNGVFRRRIIRVTSIERERPQPKRAEPGRRATRRKCREKRAAPELQAQFKKTIEQYADSMNQGRIEQAEASACALLGVMSREWENKPPQFDPIWTTIIEAEGAFNWQGIVISQRSDRSSPQGRWRIERTSLVQTRPLRLEAQTAVRFARFGRDLEGRGQFALHGSTLSRGVDAQKP